MSLSVSRFFLCWHLATFWRLVEGSKTAEQVRLLEAGARMPESSGRCYTEVKLCYVGPLRSRVHYSGNDLSLTNFKCMNIRELEKNSKKQLLYVFIMVSNGKNGVWQLGRGSFWTMHRISVGSNEMRLAGSLLYRHMHVWCIWGTLTKDSEIFNISLQKHTHSLHNLWILSSPPLSAALPTQ